MTFRQANLEVMEQCQPELYKKIRTHAGSPVGDFVATAAGIPSIRLLAPSKAPVMAYGTVDPWRDAAVHLETVPVGARGLVVFVGMGLGYGPLLVLRERPDVGLVVVLEPSLDLFCAALDAVDLRPLFTDRKVLVMAGDVDFDALELKVERIAAIEDTHLLRHVPSFQWDVDLYQDLDRRVFMLMNKLNATGGTTKTAGRTFFMNRLANLSLLAHSGSLDPLQNVFSQKPAVLVASGPSLDRSLAGLKQVQGHCVLIAVDSALAPLLSAGIMPDMVTSLDFSSLNFEKLAPFLCQPWPFSLVSLVKGTPLVPKRFPVHRHLWAFNEDTTSQWIVDALGIKTLVPAAFSVAQLSLGVALIMGADPIFLVGQDLGFTRSGADHAEGTIIMREGLPTDREIFYVPGIDGRPVPTERGLMGIQKRFEEIFAANPRTYYNASAAGVRLEGTETLSLEEGCARYMVEPLPVAQRLEEALGQAKPLPVAGFVKRCQETLGVVHVMARNVAMVRENLGYARSKLEVLRKKRASINSFRQLPSSLGSRLAKMDQINRLLDSETGISMHFLELTYRLLSDNDRLRADNLQLRDKEGYIPWLLAELSRIDMVNQERAEALSLYQDQLAKLIHHLEQEQGLLAGLSRHETVAGLLELARLYVASDDLLLAKPVLDRVLTLAPGQEEALVLAGEVSVGFLDFEAAHTSWALALTENPGLEPRIAEIRQRCAALWIAQADEHANAGEEGRNFLNLLPRWLHRVAMILEDCPVESDALMHLWVKHRLRAEELLAKNRLDLVQVMLEGWAVLEKRVPEILTVKARCLAARNEHDQAIEEMHKVLVLRPGVSEWIALMARLLLEAGRFDEGLLRLQEAVALDPQTALLWEELGDALVGDGDLAGAIIAFERCFVALPDRVDALKKMGDCYLQRQQAEPAIAAYEAVLLKVPGHPTAREQLQKARSLAVRQ